MSAANAGPHGTPGDRAVVRFALEHHLGLVDRSDSHPAPGLDSIDGD
ncbi:hypothetical protein [Streptomyces sp. NRRL WC-3742]|nr:hypothetical protein [Streptomyces sp. NRRL WC-3742]